MFPFHRIDTRHLACSVGSFDTESAITCKAKLSGRNDWTAVSHAIPNIEVEATIQLDQRRQNFPELRMGMVEERRSGGAVEHAFSRWTPQVVTGQKSIDKKRIRFGQTNGAKQREVTAGLLEIGGTCAARLMVEEISGLSVIEKSGAKVVQIGNEPLHGRRFRKIQAGQPTAKVVDNRIALFEIIVS
jgi:hypothetical protein